MGLLAGMLVSVSAIAAESDEPQPEDYNLSMAGALINDWCGRQWQDKGYISIHACNYQLAQQYNLEISSAHFSECVVQSGGDIVRIADCMVAQFNAWSRQEPGR